MLYIKITLDYLTKMYYIKVRMKNKISRREITKNPEKFGLNNTSGKFVNFLRGFEDREILPKPISAASGSDSAAKSEGYYFPAFIEMLKDLQWLMAGKRYSSLGQKEWLEEKYAKVYNLYDIIQLFRLRFLTRDILLHYLEMSQLTNKQKKKIAALYDSKPSYQDAKNAILDMLCQIKISSEAAMQ